MQLREWTESSRVIELNVEEVRILKNALNEVCDGVQELGDDMNFSARMGVNRSECRSLLEEVNALDVG
jgi:hypothetical protein